MIPTGIVRMEGLEQFGGLIMGGVNVPNSRSPLHILPYPMYEYLSESHTENKTHFSAYALLLRDIFLLAFRGCLLNHQITSPKAAKNKYFSRKYSEILKDFSKDFDKYKEFPTMH